MEAGDLASHLHAQFRIQVRERLVEQEHIRLAHQSASQRDALLLPAREMPGLAVEQTAEAKQLRRLPDAGVDVGPRHAAELQPERHVLEHAHVRIQRVVLEHHGDVPVLRGDVVDDALADAHFAGRNRLEPGDHAEGRALATPGGADEHDKLSVRHREIHAVHGDSGPAPLLVYFPNPDECHLGHEHRSLA